MINKSILALIAVVAAAGVASSAFAQSFSRSEGTGNPLPSVYDAQGGVHRLTFGYYGPAYPPMPGSNDKVAARQSSPDKIAGHQDHGVRIAGRQNHGVRIGARLSPHYD
jgi:hypothetical protein